MQVGQDRAVVDDDDAAAHALHLLIAAGFVELVVAAHAHHRVHHRVGGLGGTRRQRLVLHRVQHGVVDVFLRQFGRGRTHRVARGEQAERERDADDEDDGAIVALQEAGASRGGLGWGRAGRGRRPGRRRGAWAFGSRRTGRSRGSRLAGPICAAVKRRLLHRNSIDAPPRVRAKVARALHAVMASPSAGRCAPAERVPHARRAVFPAERFLLKGVTRNCTGPGPSAVGLRCGRCGRVRC